jgi:hypothetical protein
MIRNLLLMIVWVLSVSALFAQAKPVLSFKEESFDFGSIKESDGSVSHVFEFTNTGSTPLIITDVEPSCDCTTPEWTKSPVVRGAKGVIKVTYNPLGRGGYFKKEIAVSSNSSAGTVVLSVSGVVVRKEPIVEQKYTFAANDIRMTRNYISFDTVYQKQRKVESIEVINTGKSNVELKFTSPGHLKVMPAVLPIEAGKKVTFIVAFDATLKSDYGFVADYIKFTVNNQSDPKYFLTATASLCEDFSKLTVDQKANAPVVALESNSFPFGKVAEGEKVTYNFKVTNKGRTDLVLRKLSSTCGCTTAAPTNNNIKPGKTETIKITFDTQGRTGEQTKVITVITNSPSMRTFNLTLKGTVEAKGVVAK